MGVEVWQKIQVVYLIYWILKHRCSNTVVDASNYEGPWTYQLHFLHYNQWQTAERCNENKVSSISLIFLLNNLGYKTPREVIKIPVVKITGLYA